ncbi:MAG: hypothetical protein JWQ94_750 [Tardiphaga sp.]|jgi:hypothetical protein|nr:hypothetical protein [Tardiphaga sp.]
MIDSQQAHSALADITDIARRVRQSQFYRHASAMLMLWGALTFFGYVISFAMPSLRSYLWIAVFVAGVVGSVVIGAASRRRAGVNTFNAKAAAALVVFIAFGAIWSVGVGHFSGRQLAAFWPTYFMLPYLMVGLWLGSAFVAIGTMVIALTLIGYVWAGPWFELWMAFVNGGGLLLGGFWMRRS